MAGNSKKLLVADDSLTIQKVIRLALSNEGYEIQTVSDGNDAIQQISLFRPDVVLIDVSLPGKTAFEVKNTINEQGDFPEVRFVLMSSAFEKVDESLAAQVEFHGRLTKPFDPGHLRQILTEVLAQVAAKRMEATTFLPRPPAAPEYSEVGEGVPDISDLMEPIKPVSDLPVAPPGDQAFVGSLWEEPSIQSAPVEPQVTPPMEDSSESDIKHLTEKTIRMSGLVDEDLQQWSVNETARKAPSAPATPPSALPPTLPSEPFSVLGDNALANFRKQEPALRPFPEMADLGGSNFHLDPPADLPPAEIPAPPPPTAASAYFNAPETGDFAQSHAIQPPPAPLSPPAIPTPGIDVPADSSLLPLSASQMEEIIRKQLEEAFQRIAKQLLPDIAERVIKQEINRMLNEKP